MAEKVCCPLQQLVEVNPYIWRGEPLRDYETVVRLIAATTTDKGLTVTCLLDTPNASIRLAAR